MLLLAERYGEEYASGQVIEIASVMIKSKNYIYRVSAIEAFIICKPILTRAKTTAVLREFLVQTEKDQVPNVAIMMIKTLRALQGNIEDGLLQNEVRAAFEKYTVHEEFDVSYFAKKAMVVIFKMKFSDFFGIKTSELKFAF